MNGIRSLETMALIVFAHGTEEPPSNSVAEEALANILQAASQDLLQSFALGEGGPLTNEAVKRQPRFDLEFGQAARTIQRWYRGYRVRRYLKIAAHPPNYQELQVPGVSGRNYRRPVQMKTLFEVAPPRAFAKDALPHQGDTIRFVQEMLRSHQAWIYFLEHTATPDERRDFNSFAHRLVLERLDHVRTYEAGRGQFLEHVGRGAARGFRMALPPLLPVVGPPATVMGVGLAGAAIPIVGSLLLSGLFVSGDGPAIPPLLPLGIASGGLPLGVAVMGMGATAATMAATSPIWGGAAAAGAVVGAATMAPAELRRVVALYQLIREDFPRLRNSRYQPRRPARS